MYLSPYVNQTINMSIPLYMLILFCNAICDSCRLFCCNITSRFVLITTCNSEFWCQTLNRHSLYYISENCSLEGHTCGMTALCWANIECLCWTNHRS